MKQLYLGLKARANAVVVESTGVPRFKFIGMWNNQMDRLKEGKSLSFRLPALFFEFESPTIVDSVGNGVQVFDPLKIKCHILSEFYNEPDENETFNVNLDVFDLERYLYLGFQLYQVTGADYGTSPLNRTGIEWDNDHDNIYHCIQEYTTTWTDNSMTQPVGGYEIDPPLDADITVEKVNPVTTPTVTVSDSTLAFGNVLVTEDKELTFTIQGQNLTNDVIISTSNALFLVALGSTFSTRVVLSPENGTLPETTITVKFSPSATGAISHHLNYGTPGSNGEIAVTGTGV